MTVTQQTLKESLELVNEALKANNEGDTDRVFYSLVDLKNNLKYLNKEFVDIPF